MGFARFPGAMPSGLHLSCRSPKPRTHPWGWQPRAPLTFRGWLLEQGGETLASSLEKRPAPLLAFPTEPTPPESLTNGEEVSWFLKNMYEYMHLCSTDFF